MRQVQQGSRRRPPARSRTPHAPAPAPDEPGPLFPVEPKKRRRLIVAVLTHNATILCVVIALLTVGVYNFSVGKGDPPPAGNLSIDQLSALLNNTQVDPGTANAVAVAKQRAHDQQVAARKAEEERIRALEEKAKRDSKARAELKAKVEASKSAAALQAAATNPAANQALGKQMNQLKGWGRCWPSLLTMWNHESGWDQHARNPYGGAYGIPQALPGSKMASAGANWQNSSAVQIAWGLGYIAARYGDPCQAWSFWQAHSWY